MKQIKTIIRPVELSALFDAEVNRLLRDGWQLKKQTVLTLSGEPNEVGSCTTAPSLYAEMERELSGEAIS